MNTNSVRFLRGRRVAAALAACGALAALPALASAHPSVYFSTAYVAKTPEIQTLTVTTTPWQPTAGAPQITSATASAADVQAAIDADPAAISYTPSGGSPTTAPGYDNVRVTGAAGGPYTVTFIGSIAGINVNPLAPVNATVSTTQDGGAAVTYATDPTGQTTAIQPQTVVSSDGYALGYRETNGEGPVLCSHAWSDGSGTHPAYCGGGLLNLSKVEPTAYRANMTTVQKLEYPAAQSGIQLHATCESSNPASVAYKLSDPTNILAVWARPSDGDIFYNYIPWQATSAGFGDDPATWIPTVKTLTGIDLSTLSTTSDFTSACASIGGTYYPADTKSVLDSADVANQLTAATTPLNAQITGLTGQIGTLNAQVTGLTGQIGTLNGQVSTLTSQNQQLTSENAALAAAKAADDTALAQLRQRAVHLTVTSTKISWSAPTVMVTGPFSQPLTVTITVSGAIKKTLHVGSTTLATKTTTFDSAGAALVSVTPGKAVLKALAKHKKAVAAVITATSGSAQDESSVSLIS